MVDVDIYAANRRMKFEREREEERERIARGPTPLRGDGGTPLPQAEIDRLNRSYAAIARAGGASVDGQVIGSFVELVFQLACDIYDNLRTAIADDVLIPLFDSIPAGADALQIYMTFQPEGRRDLVRTIAKDHAREYLAYFGRMDFYATLLSAVVNMPSRTRSVISNLKRNWPESLRAEYDAVDNVRRYFDIMNENRNNPDQQDNIRALVMKITRIFAQYPRLFAAIPTALEGLLLYQNAMFKADYSTSDTQ